MLLLVVLMLLNLAGSFFCSLAEAAVLASSEARIRARLEEGLKGSRRLLGLRRNPGHTLASIVFLNNFFAVAGTAVLTSIASEVLPDSPAAMPVFIAVQTGLIIAFGEILPKVLGEANPEPIASAVVGVLLWIGRIMTPFILLVEVFVSWARPKKRVLAGDEGEIKELARMGRDVGHLDPQEAELIHRIFQLDDIT